jgi:hypothetical protein
MHPTFVDQQRQTRPKQHAQIGEVEFARNEFDDRVAKSDKDKIARTNNLGDKGFFLCSGFHGSGLKQNAVFGKNISEEKVKLISSQP